MTRGRLVVHAHFYQPSRVDPFTGAVPPDPNAAPYRDWNERIDAECYRPNAERGTIARISWNLGPTLASWLASADPGTYRRFIAADAGVPDGAAPTAIAQAYHHTILPLAPAHDRRTEILWGARDFELRFGRRPEAMWLPETAVDRPTLRVLAEAGIRGTILAPWQAQEPAVDVRQPYRVELGGGRTVVVAFYDAGLSAAVSFDPSATSDADRFARERVGPRLGAPLPGGAAPVVVIATDGELYGHHQPFRDLFLQRLVAPGPNEPDRGFDITTFGALLREPGAHPPIHVRDRTSWSCHHGVLRWTSECPDVPDGRWKGPLRSAFERLAAGIDTLTEEACRAMPHRPDPWAARDDYIEVVHGAESAATFSARWLGDGAPAGVRRRFEQLLTAQRWRLAMFASDGWFWDDPIRVETRQVLRAAARAARIVAGVTGVDLEPRLVDDLTLLESPSARVDGSAIYRQALAEVGQPPPAG